MTNNIENHGFSAIIAVISIFFVVVELKFVCLIRFGHKQQLQNGSKKKFASTRVQSAVCRCELERRALALKQFRAAAYF